MSGSVNEPADADATIVLPTPGRKRNPFSPALDRQAAAADVAALGGLNALVEAANPILAVVAQIRHALRHPDPAGLRARMREQVELFEASARAAGLPEAQVDGALLALCALLDDAALATPWGRQWDSLLAEVCNEQNGGERFFTWLEQISAAAAINLDLLEFAYVCLALGFEGKFRGGEGGRQALTQTRVRLYELITSGRSGGAESLSARWKGAGVRAQRVSGGLALWGVASACALVLALLYFGYSVLLGSRSDPVARQLAQLKPVAVAEPAPRAQAKAAEPLAPVLAKELAEAIGEKDVEVSEAKGGTLIALKSDRLFAPGSAKLDARLNALILRIAEKLDALPGAIVVTGHTDDQPIRTARFPSNFELSTERAKSVVGLMQSKIKDAARLKAEGLGDSEPLAPNDSAANRAKNRRVAIILRQAQ